MASVLDAATMLCLTIGNEHSGEYCPSGYREKLPKLRESLRQKVDAGPILVLGGQLHYGIL